MATIAGWKRKKEAQLQTDYVKKNGSYPVPGGNPAPSADIQSQIDAYLAQQQGNLNGQVGQAGSFANMVNAQPQTPERMAQDLINRYGEDYVANSLQGDQADPAASGGSGGGDNGAGAALQQQLEAIKQQYAIHRDELDRQHTQLLASLGEYANQANTGIGAQRADYNTQAGAANGAVQKQYADAKSGNAANQAAAEAEMARFGLDKGALAPTVAQGQSYLDQQGNAQSALGQRLQQVADSGFAQQQATTENIRNAASGQLDNSYADFKAKLDLGRINAEADANNTYQSNLRSSASKSAGVGADGLTAYQRAQLQLSYDKRDDEQQKADLAELPTGFDLSTLDPGSTAYQAAFQGTLKDAQAYLSSNVDNKTISAEEAQRALATLGQNYNSAKSTYRAGQAAAAKQSNSAAIRAALLKTYKGR